MLHVDRNSKGIISIREAVQAKRGTPLKRFGEVTKIAVWNGKTVNIVNPYSGGQGNEYVFTKFGSNPRNIDEDMVPLEDGIDGTVCEYYASVLLVLLLQLYLPHNFTRNVCKIF